jgi:hypothetical protein
MPTGEVEYRLLEETWSVKCNDFSKLKMYLNRRNFKALGVFLLRSCEVPLYRLKGSATEDK